VVSLSITGFIGWLTVSDDGFMTLEEFRSLYGPELAKKELVVLAEHDGERMWSRDATGWHRLGDGS